ncbi:MAG: FAD-binding protein [Lentisphaerae bacterium]|nr:FAD-binding protein [Lentisphaerota bacterium]
MLRVHDIHLPLDHAPDDIAVAAARVLGVKPGALQQWVVRRQAIDARRKNAVTLTYSVDVVVANESRLLQAAASPQVVASPDESYHPASPGTAPLQHRPVVVGTGPAGLFAALTLAQAGYRPIVLERGRPVPQRCRDVEAFWNGGALDPHSNAQFGEGGAGTFSDGKLTTLINDPRCRKVLEEFVAAGADPSILVSAKPHLGTDRLRAVVVAIRQRLESLGASVRFEHQVTGLDLDQQQLRRVRLQTGESLPAQVCVLAIGHSARDTVAMLHHSGLRLTPKPFSVGVRIEHPQALIDTAQYGRFAGHPRLGPADYKLAYHAPHGRSAYTFCMCPGGEVIAAASECGGIVTNGMSASARDRVNANAAVLVGVTPADFPGDSPLSGFDFQRQWESLAFALGGANYCAPAQRVGDFLRGVPGTQFGRVTPSYTPGVRPADLRGCLPPYVADTLRAALPQFGRRVAGFDLPDAILTGVETRSSSPVSMPRSESGESSIGGLYPAGEGAGHAGGITSAAVDGIRTAEAIIARFAPPR